MSTTIQEILIPDRVLIPEHLRTGDEKLDKIQKEFVHFSRSRSGYHTDESFAEQFVTLCNRPWVQHVGFTNKKFGEPRELLIGTEYVHILNHSTGFTNLIGEFIIRIQKRPTPMFCFLNIAGEKTSIKHDMVLTYQHPHINGSGEMCMTSGREEILESITSGDLLNAADMLWEALNIYSAGYAYVDMDELWPTVEDLE